MVSKEAGQTELQDDWYLMTATALLEQQSYEIEVYEAINEYLVDYLAKSNRMSHQGTKMLSLACALRYWLSQHFVSYFCLKFTN